MAHITTHARIIHPSVIPCKGRGLQSSFPGAKCQLFCITASTFNLRNSSKITTKNEYVSILAMIERLLPKREKIMTVNFLKILSNFMNEYILLLKHEIKKFSTQFFVKLVED